DAVMSEAIDLARGVFVADAYAMWRVDQAGNWRIVRAVGVSETFAWRVIPTDPGPSQVPFDEPFVCEDVATAPLLADLHDTYEREGIASLIVFPLAIRGERRGTLVFYSQRPRTYGQMDIQVGRALASLAAAALTSVELLEEQRTAREGADHARQQAAFLAEAGTVLSASLDYEATLTAVANLAVPSIADWCAVDIVGERGALQRVAVAHVDPAKLEYARTLEQRYP